MLKEVGEWGSTVLGPLFLAWRTHTPLLGCAGNVAERRQDWGGGDFLRSAQVERSREGLSRRRREQSTEVKTIHQLNQP